MSTEPDDTTMETKGVNQLHLAGASYRVTVPAKAIEDDPTLEEGIDLVIDGDGDGQLRITRSDRQDR